MIIAPPELLNYRRKQAEILAGVCGQREALERRVYEQDVQLELSLDELETSVQVLQLMHGACMVQCMIGSRDQAAAGPGRGEGGATGCCCPTDACMTTPAGLGVSQSETQAQTSTCSI